MKGYNLIHVIKLSCSKDFINNKLPPFVVNLEKVVTTIKQWLIKLVLLTLKNKIVNC